MKRNILILFLCPALFAISHPVLADKSEKDTPPEEQEAKMREVDIPAPVQEYLSYLEDLDKRYPDSAKVDTERFVAEEGEKAALLYCRAAGFDGPCAPSKSGGGSVFKKVDVVKSGWWDWLINHLFNIGVIPEQNACPAPYSWLQIYMDDEDRRNANSRWGWLGATVSNNNTTWRFCKLDTITSLLFRPLPTPGNQYDYEVLELGLFCPSGARRVIRYQDNEDWNNQDSASGDIFPNVMVNILAKNWMTFTCHFDGAAPSVLGHMSGFPNIGMKYGVFAPTNMPLPYALQHGYVYQDDEDFLNTNFWIGSPDAVMGGGTNTWRALAKVK